MKRVVLALAVLLSISRPSYAQQWDQVNGSMQVKSGPSAPLVIIDQTTSGQKIISLRANGTEVCYATATSFTCTGGFTFPTSCTGTYTGPFTNGTTSTGQCINGSAVTTTTSTAVTSTVPYLAPSGTAALPGLAFSSAPSFGITYDSSDSVGVSRNALQTVRFDGNGITLDNRFVIGWNSTAPFVNGVVSTPDVSLSRGAAGTLWQRNGTATQKFLIGPASSSLQIEKGNGGIGYLLTVDAQHLQFGTNSVDRWYIGGTTGHLLASTDNTHDIGASGATRPRNYFGSGSITSSGATAGIGYATGAGGSVTQITSKATGVTLNTVTGNITTAGDLLAASTAVSFTLTNSAIAAQDVITATQYSGGTAGAYFVNCAAAAGSATCTIRNLGLAALTEAIVIKFVVFKAVIS